MDIQVRRRGSVRIEDRDPRSVMVRVLHWMVTNPAKEVTGMVVVREQEVEQQVMVDYIYVARVEYMRR